MRRLRFALLVLFAGMLSTPALAEFVTFEKTKFENLVKSSAPVIVHTYESWCPTCRVQASVLEALQKDPKFVKITMFRANPGTDRDALAPYKVSGRSIILVFAGGKQVGRLDWVTDTAQIRALLEQAVAQAGG